MNIKLFELKEILSCFSDDDEMVFNGIYNVEFCIARSQGGYSQIQLKKDDKVDEFSVVIVDY